MPLSPLLSKRFAELNGSFSKLSFVASDYGAGRRSVATGDWKRWATSAQNAVLAACGASSPHYENFTAALQSCMGWEDEVLALRGVFLAAKEDYEGGYVVNVDLRVSGEVFGDFVGLAKQALGDGHMQVAAVLASAALEDALKRYANANDLSVDGKTMAEVVNAIKGKGLVSGAEKSLLDTMPKLRNYALHADWDKLSEPAVSGVIGYVEQFLLKHFS